MGGQVRALAGAELHAHGRAVQVDSIKPKLKPPGTKRLKLNCDILLSTSAFKFNLRRYNMAMIETLRNGTLALAGTRGLHSSTFHLNLSALYGIGGARKAMQPVSRGC